MKCPRCHCNNIVCDTSQKTNTGERVLHTIGAGALAIGGIITLPIPGLHYVGLGCLFGATAVEKSTPSKRTVYVNKYKCLDCGNRWSDSE